LRSSQARDCPVPAPQMACAEGVHSEAEESQMTDWLPDPTPAERRAEERDTNIALGIVLAAAIAFWVAWAIWGGTG
jgi:ferric-dicitrate binding protein FerR (iron transport regulator)